MTANSKVQIQNISNVQNIGPQKQQTAVNVQYQVLNKSIRVHEQNIRHNMYELHYKQLINI